MQDEHHRAMELLQRQLDHAEGELFRLQRTAQKSPPGGAAAGAGETDGVTEYIRDPRHTERPGAEVSGQVCQKANDVVWNCSSRHRPESRLRHVMQHVKTRRQINSASFDVATNVFNFANYPCLCHRCRERFESGQGLVFTGHGEH